MVWTCFDGPGTPPEELQRVEMDLWPSQLDPGKTRILTKCSLFTFNDFCILSPKGHGEEMPGGCTLRNLPHLLAQVSQTFNNYLIEVWNINNSTIKFQHFN